MKRIAVLALALVLTGCGTKPDFETVSDQLEPEQPLAVQPVQVNLPEETAVTALKNDDGDILYLCDGYTVTLHTGPAGDVDGTLLEATGFSKDALRIMETKMGDYTRYDCVWIAAGEGEEQVGRLALIDDGACHYVLTAMASASETEAVIAQWKALFGSFAVGEPVSTGS